MVGFLSGQPSKKAADWWLNFVIGVNRVGSELVQELCFLALLMREGSSSNILELLSVSPAKVGIAANEAIYADGIFCSSFKFVGAIMICGITVFL